MSAPQARLGLVDRYLTPWIPLAMIAGVVLATTFAGLPQQLERLSLGSTNLLIAAGLIIMMYPPLAKVRYEEQPLVFRDRRVLDEHRHRDLP